MMDDGYFIPMALVMLVMSYVKYVSYIEGRLDLTSFVRRNPMNYIKRQKTSILTLYHQMHQGVKDTRRQGVKMRKGLISGEFIF